jgi:hypothetical protein
MTTIEELHQQLPSLIDQLVGKRIMTDVEGDTLLDTIMKSKLSLGELNALIIDLANEAKLDIVTNTSEKVARWRKIIINLMLAGIAGGILERVIPGIYYTLYENIYTTITTLLTAGYNNQQIRNIINNPPSVKLPSVPDTSGVMIGLTDGLKTGFFIAASIAVGCINMLCSVAQKTINQLTIDNFNMVSRLATHIAIPGGVSNAFGVLRGDFDIEIADFIDRGVIQQILNRADDTVSDVKRTIAGSVAESAIDVDNMSLGIKWTNIANNRMTDPSINSIINREIDKEIERMMDNPQKIVSNTELLNDILNVLRADDKVNAIAEFKNKYQNISKTMPKLLELLTAKAAELKANFESYSQPEANTYTLPRASNKRISSSLPDDYEYPSGFNPMIIKYEQKIKSTPLDAAIENDVFKRITRKKEAKMTWDKNTDRFLYEFINVWLSDMNPDFVQKLNLISSEDHNAIIKRIKDMARDLGGYNLLSSVDNPNLDRSKEELLKIFNTINDSIQVQMDAYTIAKKEDLGGGRHYKKSRQYKKRRSTLKRRRVKGRRTRKGKKRISTKRKR